MGLLAVIGLSALGCASETADVAPPPAVDTRFTLRVDDKAIGLDKPSGLRTSPTDARIPAVLMVSAMTADFIYGTGAMAQITLSEPFQTGTFDCTPDERGHLVRGAAVSFSGNIGFPTKMTECVINVQYIADDRIVGTFAASAQAPEGGAVTRAEGEFDAPIAAATGSTPGH